MYVKFFKRFLDFSLSLIALIVLSPLLLVLTIIGAIAMRGNPFFVQYRPGKIDPETGKEKIFKLIKFRTMDNRRDKNDELLPDSVRLNAYGKFLRSTSLDELPEFINILCGDMAIVGPRPQLVRDMVFMTPEQRRRHTVRQGLTGLAQVSGRNSLTWEQKFVYDLEYIENITFLGDLKIILKTIAVIFSNADADETGSDTADDFGDYLLKNASVNETVYDEKLDEAKELLELVSRR